MAKLTVSDLIHRWANRNLTEKELGRNGYAYASNGRYEANNKEFYFNNKLVGLHYKKYIFIENFTSSGCFGNTVSNHSLVNSVPTNKLENIIVSDTILTEQILNNKDIFADWFKEYFIEKNYGNFDRISYTKEFIHNNRCSVYWIEDIFFNVNLPNAIYNRYKGVIGRIKIKKSHNFIKYHGWGNRSTFCKTIYIDHTIRQLLKTDLNYFLTDKEKDHFEFKKWYLKHRKGCPVLNYKTGRTIYDDPEKKERREIQVKEYIKKQEKLRAKRNAEQQSQRIREYYKSIVEWLNDERKNLPYCCELNTYDFLKIGRDKSYPYVLTSMNVSITIEDAKRALALFRRYKDRENVKLYDKNIRISYYTVHSIKTEFVNIIRDGDIETVSDKCLNIGCHMIPYFEVERFLKVNKLNW